MDNYLLVTDPIGFFVFTFCPGLLFWTVAYILKERRISWAVSLWYRFEIFSVLRNNLLDRITVISFTGILLNILSLIIIRISPLGVFFSEIFNNSISYLTLLHFFVILIFVVILCVLMVIFRRCSWFLSSVMIIFLFIAFIWFMSMTLSNIYNQTNMLIDTIYISYGVGLVSFLISILVFFIPVLDKLSYIEGERDWGRVIVSSAFFVGVILILLELLPMSVIYNIQTVSPIHYDVIPDNCTNSTISSKLVLSNSLGRDIAVTGLEPKNSILKKDFEIPARLSEKRTLVLYVEFKKDELIKYKNGGYYIHLKTTEGTIPIQIPVDKCEK